MAEESDLEKTEEASERRIEKAREEGDVPRSKELSTFMVLIAATMGFWLSGDSIAKQLKHLLTAGLQFDRAYLFDLSQFNIKMAQQLVDLLLVFFPFFGLILIAALISPMLIGGFLFSSKALGPNFGKLNPMEGLGNMFSKRSLVELLKAIAKTLIVGSVAWLVIRSQLDTIFALETETFNMAGVHHIHLLLVCFTAMVCALALIALVDAPYQIYHYSQKLMMTRQEVKEEAKESDGNPEIKAKMRAQQREMARRRMMAQIPSADVVVTNPTHYAVALSYPENSNLAPTVVAKGVDHVAERIKEIARDHHVVLIEMPPLARALYQHTELNDEIPRNLYTAVAQVLAYVFQLRLWQSDGGVKPVLPRDIPVPAGMDPLEQPSTRR